MLRTDAGTRQYEANGAQGSGCFHGRAVILAAGADEAPAASYRDGTVTVTCGGRSWNVAHEMMQAEAAT